MRTSLAVLAAFAFSYAVTQIRNGSAGQQPKIAPAYADQANDALEAVDRLFEIQDEARLIFIPARLEAEKYLAKAGRLAGTSGEYAAQEALREYYAEMQLCKFATDGTGRVSDSCKGGPRDPSRIKAFAAINNRPLPAD